MIKPRAPLWPHRPGEGGGGQKGRHPEQEGGRSKGSPPDGAVANSVLSASLLPGVRSAPPWPWRNQSGSPGPTGASQMAHRAPGGRPSLCTAHPCWGHERKGGEQPCSGPPGPRWPTLLTAAMHGGGMQTPGGGAPPNKHRSSARPLWTRSLPHWSPRGQERTDTWGVGGECPSVRSPTNASDFYSFFLCFFLLFHPTSIFFLWWLSSCC